MRDMSLLDNLYPASFRGISFLIEDSSVSGGRKTVTHEFPNSDRRYVEDLGLSNEIINITACVPTADYFSRRDAIKAALDQEGYGTLVHPFYGLRNVAVIGYTINESPSDLGDVKIAINFSVAQELLFPSGISSDSFISGQVTALFDTMKTGFFKSYEWVAKYAHNATSILSGLNDVTSIVSSVADTFTTRSEFDDETASVYRSKYTTYNNDKASYITTKVTDEVNLYDETRGLVEALDDVPNTGNQGFGVGRKLARFTLTEPINPASTKDQISRAKNQNSLIDMMLVLAFGVTCRNIGLYAVKSLEDIELLRTELDTQYEVLLNRSSLSEQVFQDVQDLRSSTIRYLDNQVLVAPAIETVEVSDMPLTVLEYQQYGGLPIDSIDSDGTINSRTEDLRELNRLTNQDPTALRNTVKMYVNP